MRKLLITVGFLAILPILGPSQVADNKPVPLEAPADFVGDGCTMFPDGNWGDCCLAHDKAYFRGGTRAERKAADKQLFKCVRAKGGLKHRFISDIMWLGVRIGGVSWLPTSFRWGFGQKKK